MQGLKISSKSQQGCIFVYDEKPPMKKSLITAFILLIVATVQAQTFEGIIRWSFKTEITDPAAKAKMDAAQAKMNDPAHQAKMKEMQAKMNDPEFKKMMDANPQLKAQMEAMAKMSEGGDINSMMPKSMEVRVKNQNAISKMEGGIMGNMEILYLKDKAASYRIDRQTKTYSVLPAGNSHSAHQPEVKVTKTSETLKVLNHSCTKYLVESSLNGKTFQQFVWATKDIKDFDMKSIANQGGNGQSFYFDKIEGVPLKMQMMMPQGTMIMEAIEIKKQALPASDFAIPADYKEVKLGH
jgi:hypothetical protein